MDEKEVLDIIAKAEKEKASELDLPYNQSTAVPCRLFAVILDRIERFRAVPTRASSG